jgi:hypothetical protein
MERCERQIGMYKAAERCRASSLMNTTRHIMLI